MIDAAVLSKYETTCKGLEGKRCGRFIEKGEAIHRIGTRWVCDMCAEDYEQAARSA